MVLMTTGTVVAVGPCDCSSTCGVWFTPGSLVGTMDISGGVLEISSMERALVGEGVNRSACNRVKPPPRGVALALAGLGCAVLSADHLLEVLMVGPKLLVAGSLLAGLVGSPWGILLLSPFLGFSSAISCSRGSV